MNAEALSARTRKTARSAMRVCGCSSHRRQSSVGSDDDDACSKHPYLQFTNQELPCEGRPKTTIKRVEGKGIRNQAL